MKLLILNLNNEHNDDKLEFDIGDVLIFYDGYNYDYYLTIMDSISREYSLLSLEDNKSYKKYPSLLDLINEANNADCNNGYELVEIIKSNEVVLKRIEE